MIRKQSKYRHIILLESRRGRMKAEMSQPSPPQHEPVPNRTSDRPPTTSPQLIVPHPGRDPLPTDSAPEHGPAPLTMREYWNEEINTILPPYARRKFRGWVVTRFAVRRVQRLIPMKSTSFRLRYRNLSYKRRWNLVWC